MQKNLKNAATIVAGVAVAAASITTIIKAKKNAKPSNCEETFIFLPSLEMLAFDEASTILTDRMLAGYYDDKPDSEYLHDFDVLYATFLKK